VVMPEPREQALGEYLCECAKMPERYAGELCRRGMPERGCYCRRNLPVGCEPPPSSTKGGAASRVPSLLIRRDGPLVPYLSQKGGPHLGTKILPVPHSLCAIGNRTSMEAAGFFLPQSVVSSPSPGRGGGVGGPAPPRRVA